MITTKKTAGSVTKLAGKTEKVEVVKGWWFRKKRKRARVALIERW